MAVRPANAPPTPISLDTLFQRHTIGWQPPARRPSPPPSAAVQPARLAPDAPVAAILPVTVATCAGCGRVHRNQPTFILARYEPNAHSVRYTRTDALLVAHLPRETRETHITIPYCEKCF